MAFMRIYGLSHLVTPLYYFLHAIFVGGPFVLFGLLVIVFQIRLQRKLSFLSRKDGLTGLNNRRTFFESADLRRKECKGGVLLLIDADNFKRINDTYGHLVGDAILVAVVSAIYGQIRQDDTLSRYGGEEFALILPGTPLTSAKKLMVRLKDRIAAISHTLENKQLVSVTASIGIASLDGSKHFEYPSNLVKAADLALYAAKNSGRNQIIEWNSSLN